LEDHGIPDDFDDDGNPIFNSEQASEEILKRIKD
jgi:hypothetical protein